MNCPICHNVRMREIEKDGVIIDICPDCKGVWLDRGELEKLMSEVREERQVFNDWYYERDKRPEQGDYVNHNYDSGHRPQYYKPRKKKSVLDRLGDLFD